ncbi:MAG: discoidin domain-containing protein [Candidatus Levyibacteriota bacterium]
MYKRIKEVINKYYPFSYFAILAVVTFAVLYQTIFFYFWVDDWDLFLKVTHPDLSPWGLAPGPFGSGPYRYLHTPFYFLYPLFGLNAHAYFAVSILIYFIAALSVFLLTLEITKKRSIALGTGIIFASMPYIGSYTITHLSNSYQMFMTIILSCFTVLFLYKFYSTQKLKYYIFCVLLFIATIEFMFLRAHGLLFMVIACALLFKRGKKGFKIIHRFLFLVPLAFLYFYFYQQVSSGENSQLRVFISTMIHGQFSIGYLANLFGTFSNILIPYRLTMEFYEFIRGGLDASGANGFLTVFNVAWIGVVGFWRKRDFKFYSALILLQIAFLFFSEWIMARQFYLKITEENIFNNIFGFGLFSAVVIVVRNWFIQKNDNFIVALFALAWIFGQYIGYFISSPASSLLGSEDRYLTVATVGSAILMGIIFSKLSFRKTSLYPVAIFCISFIYFLFMTGIASENIKNNSQPVEAMYSKILSEIKELPRDVIILLDISSDPVVVDRVKRSYPESAFSIFYNLPSRANVVLSVEKALVELKKNNVGVDKIVAFHIGRDGVINNTERLRKLLSESSTALVLKSEAWKSSTKYSTQGTFQTQSISKKIGHNTVGLNPSIEAKVGFGSIVPSKASVVMNISSLLPQTDNFPYFMPGLEEGNTFEGDFLADSIFEAKYQVCPSRTEILEEERQRQEFLRSAKVTADSYWTNAEDTYLSDGLFDINWIANINTWRGSQSAEINIDLGEEKPIQRLIWVNYAERSTPGDYEIAVSKNKVIWDTVKKVSNGPSRQRREIVYEQFPITNARYVRMNITGTVGNETLSMSEIWTDSLSSTIDAQQKEDVISSPFSCLVNTQDDFYSILNALGASIKARIWWKTDSEDAYKLTNSREIALYADGLSHTYDIILPAGGTILETLKIDSFQIPVDINIVGSQIRSLTFEQLMSGDYTKDSVMIE